MCSGPGVNIELPSHRVEECLKEVGIAFLFAPMMHLAMKFAIGPRREIGIRTLFNILGHSPTRQKLHRRSWVCIQRN